MHNIICIDHDDHAVILSLVVHHAPGLLAATNIPSF